MPGQPGLPNLTAMRGRRKGGATKPQSTTPQGMAAHAEVFLVTLAARHYSAASIEAHRWALRQFTAWAASHGAPDPASYQRDNLEVFQHFLHRYRSPRGGRPLAINTQLAQLGCLRRFFARLCRAGTRLQGCGVSGAGGDHPQQHLFPHGSCVSFWPRSA